MARNLSSAAIASSHMLENTEDWLILLEIDHSTLANPYYLVNNSEEITSNGNTYISYPFQIVFGTDDGEKLPSTKLTIDNVDRALVDIIRSIEESPDVNVKLVLASTPDYIEIEISELKLRTVQYDAYTISGTLYADDILNQRYPKDNITIAAGYIGQFK